MSKQKKRHGCLTIWLAFMLFSNSIGILTYIFANSTVRESYPNAPLWVFPMLTIGGILNIIFIIALFRWKKWGFWGSIVTYVISFGVNLLVGLNITQALFGLSGLAILFGVLQIGKEHKGWSQLE